MLDNNRNTLELIKDEIENSLINVDHRNNQTNDNNDDGNNIDSIDNNNTDNNYITDNINNTDNNDNTIAKIRKYVRIDSGSLQRNR